MKVTFDLNEFVPVVTQDMVVVNLVNRIRERRKGMKITQKQLVSRSGVSYASIRRFEQKGEISLRSLLSILDSLGLLEEFNDLFKNAPMKDLKDM